MGSTFQYVTLEKAMEALHVSKRTVYRHVKRGLLRTAKQGQALLVSREDVQTLVELNKQNPNARPIHKKTVYQLEARIHQLETEMRVVKRMLDLHHEPLDLSIDELLSLYRMALHHLKEDWAPQSEVMWADTFIRLRLEDIEKLASAVEDDDPWRPFHQLARCMVSEPHDIDKKLQFAAGKNNVEKIAYIWVKRFSKNAKELQRTIKGDEKEVRKMVRKVRFRRSKK